MLFEVTVNWLAIIIAAAVTFIIGWLWYGPIFGKTWMRLNNVKMEGSPSMKGMAMPMFLNFIGNLVTAYALASLIAVTQSTGDMIAGMKIAFLAWLGFIACTTLLGSVLWDKKPWGLFVLNGAYWLVYLWVMAIIIYFVG